MDRRLCTTLAANLIDTHRAQGVDASHLCRILHRMPVEEVADGHTLYAEGARSETVDFLLEGAVLVRVGPEQREFARVEGPAVLGHLGVLTGLPRSATVVAAGPVRLGRMPQRELWDLVSGESEDGTALRRLLLASLSTLVRDTNARLLELVPQHGLPMPSDAPRGGVARASGATRSRPSQVDALTATFDDDLLAQLEEVSVVYTAADERERHRQRR